MPKVSVVVPVYNAERFLAQCLDSLLAQTFQELEILCVNDGSTDRSLEILEEYSARDGRLKVFTKENEGKGAAPARNLGLSSAAGEYVLFLDSDDFFEPDMVEALVGKAEAVRADVVVCQADIFDEAKKSTQDYLHISFRNVPGKDPFSYKDCPEHIFQISDVVAWNKLYRRDLLENNRLRFEPIPISDEQYIAMLAPVFARRITCVDRVFVHYRINSGQTQNDASPRHPESAYAATYSVVERMREAGIYETVKKSYLNVAMRIMRAFFDSMTEYKNVRFLYDTYRGQVFPRLGAGCLPENYFYDRRLDDWYRMICSYSLEEILFMAARGFGGRMTSAVLRFQAPLDRIPKGSRIVLVGKGMEGRYWYAQFLVSMHCEVAAWVADEKEIPPGLEYSMVVKVEDFK